ncbi:tRNA-specific 2-thiouridylase [Gammaproteobacteria bacterium]
MHGCSRSHAQHFSVPNSSRPTVTVGLSGGVDSSVAALLLQRRGYVVSTVFMKNWEEDDASGQCPAAQDYRDALAVATTLGLPLQAVSFADLYWDRVFTPFLAAYRAGYTPNPDVFCNREVKFKAFLEYALDRGARHIATGHYARSRVEDGRWHLLKGRDPTKDQSYFLYLLGQPQLAHTLFPVGELPKVEVRRLAVEAGLATHAKKDSTGICFIGERPFREFLARYLPAQPGPLVTPEGREVGRHDGLMYYTLGQRQGLGLGGQRGDSGAPWYVVAKDIPTNTLVVARGHDHPLLYSATLTASQISWVAGVSPVLPMSCRAKVRYRQEDQDCLVTALGDEDQSVRVTFALPQRAVTPGQSVVFYQGEECLGGGVIATTSTDTARFGTVQQGPQATSCVLESVV